MKFTRYAFPVALLLLSACVSHAALTSFSCAPTTAATGTLVTCLPGGSGHVSLSSSTDWLPVPDSATAGQAFTFTVGKVTENDNKETVTAKSGSAKFTIHFVLTPKGVTPPPPPTLTTLVPETGTITGAGTDTFTAKLSGAATSSTTISLSSSSPLFTVPSSITIASGSSSVTFVGTAKAVTTVTSVVVTALLAGNTAEATITLDPVITPPPVTLKSLTCAGATVTGAGTDACTVTLTGVATSAETVTLGSSSTDVTIPASVSVVVGASTANFTATAIAVTVATPVSLAATLGTSATFTLTLEPPAVTSPGLTLSATTLSFGNVNIGSSSMQSLILTSSGTAPLTITGVTTAGTGFTGTGAFTLPLTLAPEATASVSVIFAPTVAGTEAGTVTVASNVPTATVSLSGSGVTVVSGGNYSLPTAACATNNSCITAITWQTGSDLWNGGTLPVYPAGAVCNAPTTGDAGAAINSCIDAAASGTAVILPAGTYTANTQIRLKSNVVLRGAKAEGGPPFMPAVDAAATTIVIGNANAAPLTTTDFSSGGGSLTPPTTYATKSPGYKIGNAPKKGDTSFTIGSGSLVAGDWISIFADDDPTLVNANGTDGNCQWCGENTGFNMQIQIVQVTAVSGTTATISRPLYFTPYTNPQYRIYTMGTTKAGYENLRVDASKTDIGANQILLIQGCTYCWVKNVETYMTGSDSGSAHIEIDYTYGSEVRDSAFHDGRSTASGADYGFYIQWPSSDAKVENNIFSHNRHSLAFQGGGSGVAILYNYLDDMYTDDLTYFASARLSHGAHPFMNLIEGNIASHIASDDFWGTSSHTVFFRNWLRGGEPDTIYPGGSGIASFPPNNGFEAVTLYTGQSYYSFIDNVLGSPVQSGGVWPNWSDATLTATCTSQLNTGNTSCDEAPTGTPIVYNTGGTLSSVASSTATINLVGNYDFKTLGIGSNNQTGFTYSSSLYYSTKPAFMGLCPWPEQGSDLNPVDTVQQPAYQRAAGTTCGGIVQ